MGAAQACKGWLQSDRSVFFMLFSSTAISLESESWIPEDFTLPWTFQDAALAALNSSSLRFEACETNTSLTTSRMHSRKARRSLQTRSHLRRRKHVSLRCHLVL